jgi:hypothetical protein
MLRGQTLSYTPHAKLRVTHRPGFGIGPANYRENAKHCMMLAKDAHDLPTFTRYKRLEASWLALAETQDWLEGKIPPISEQPDARR